MLALKRGFPFRRHDLHANQAASEYQQQQPYSMADEEEESWQEFFDNNKTILPHPSRRITDGQKQAITGFCLTIKAVEGVRLPQALTNVR